MKRLMSLNAMYEALPVVVSEAPVSRPTKRDRTQTERAKEWLKELCTNIYRSSVYCSACDYETGTNPECPQCVKAMGRAHSARRYS